MDKAVAKTFYTLDKKGHIYVKITGEGQHDLKKELLFNGEFNNAGYKKFIQEIKIKSSKSFDGLSTSQILAIVNEVARGIRQGRD